MAWKKGPLPPDTYQWGGVVPKDMVGQSGFLFADFCGDHVMVYGDKGTLSRRVEAADVAFYDNSLELPPQK
jgi:hypothetical protein